ncbi:MAG: hypothetical protein P1V81_00070 [Planctomycetota bacterium]|nr:hypothetical protein [Planctomycetota bacterium]
MKLRHLILGALAAPILFLSSCGSELASTDGSLSGGIGNNMAILSCSLGCGSGIYGDPVTCGKGTIKANEEIGIEFTQPVDMATVTKSTFRITDAQTGLAPPGVFVLDPANPRRVIFRPEISFDMNGTPVFGFEVGRSYSIKVNGTLHSGAPYLRSTSGKQNQAGMFCNVSVGTGLVDNSPGPSQMSIYADTVTEYGPGGEVEATEEGLVSGSTELTGVWSLSTVRLVFNDIISPVTILNPSDGNSPTVRFFIDPDGLIGGSDDWIPLAGNLDLELNEATLSSVLTFTAASGFPSAGSGVVPRRIVVEVASGILDLAGSPLENPGVFGFVPEANTFGDVLLPEGGEQFATTANMDDVRSGAYWGGGSLAAGLGGGSGKLGDLHVTVGSSPYVLNTDSDDFSNYDILLEGSGTFPPTDGPQMATVTGGLFEFSSLTVDNGATLVVEGSNPARLFVRGRALVQGGIAAVGNEPTENEDALGGHPSNLLDGGSAGVGGPFAGDGGRGADRPDNTGTTLLFLPGPGNGQPNPGAVVDGFAGEGLAGGVTTFGGGEGGVHWPAVQPFGLTDFGGLQPNSLCSDDQVANPGAGGGYATNGGESQASWDNPLLNDPGGSGMWPGVNALGGDPASIGIDAEVMELSPEKGHLRGGSGGGGGGAHVALTRTNGPAFGDCLAGSITFYASHSGAGGGGGGGAIQIQAGSEVRITGAVDVSGGKGGDAADDPVGDALNGQAAPGGGGSGGSFLAQARQVLFSSLAHSVDISGGDGGLGVGGSLGGFGGAGLLRVESEFPADPMLLAPKVKPFDSGLGSPYGGADSDVILSVGDWVADASGPGARSGAQSCWLRPPGFFFQVTFPEDDFLTDPLNPVLGWDMLITTAALPATPFSYRNANDPNNPFGGSAESLFGTDLGGATPAPVVVRFQGARIAELPENLCDATLDSQGGSIQADSLTAWVRHPSELNTYWEAVFPLDPQEVEARRSNIIRYQIIFDRTSPDWPAFGEIHSFEILAKPD